ncbi:MAG: glycogen debranching protein [Chlorobiaceae bacterium]|nr:glycogen debranching protein [Chlorobiaceae bacterium]MBA4309887.1 glycogen debranching protein [Chlorobiaceae bacterium]
MKYLSIIFSFLFLSQIIYPQQLLYNSEHFSIDAAKVQQGVFEAYAKNREEIISTYKSDRKKIIKNNIDIKFSINGDDNERGFAQNHSLIIVPIDGKYVSPIYKFGEADDFMQQSEDEIFLSQPVEVTIRVDCNNVLSSFRKKGYYETFKGEKILFKDFKGFFVAGGTYPLNWDFQSLGKNEKLKLTDPDSNGVYEIKLIFGKSEKNKISESQIWRLEKEISNFPQYSSPHILIDALYNKALEEMLLNVRDDGAFMAGKEWPGVWTRDIAYSILLSFAIINPDAARVSLMAKVKDGKIIQDTGTGGSWPISSDRMIWAAAAYEIYKVTGDKKWLRNIFSIIKKSVEADLKTLYDESTGLFGGESSFLDWREQTYPRWMDPKDIFVSKCLGTNAVHFRTYEILAEIAALLGEDEKEFLAISEKIKSGMNNYLWRDEKKYFGQFLYGRNYLSLSDKSETLGAALSILFGISDSLRSIEMVENLPTTNFGTTCIYPQIPNIPPYHNDAVWPFVEAYWAWAAAKTGNEKSVEKSFASIYRAAALFLTNKENFVAGSGDYFGTQINSDRQLWSVAGNLALIYRIIFGMEFQNDALILKPFVPKKYSGHRSLKNFKYRNATIDIYLHGDGNKVTSAVLNGKQIGSVIIPENLSGKNVLVIKLSNNEIESKINLVENIFSPETPKVTLLKNGIMWNKIDDAVMYQIFVNAELIDSTENNLYLTDFGNYNYAEIQVRSVDKNSNTSFKSEPVLFSKTNSIIVEAEQNRVDVETEYKNYSGTGYIKIKKNENKILSFNVLSNDSALYAIDFSYSNNNGPINTDNRCGIRSLFLNDKYIGVIVFPQQGDQKWNGWGMSNSIKVKLNIGENIFQLKYLDHNENMNGEINSALVDFMRVVKIN